MRFLIATLLILSVFTAYAEEKLPRELAIALHKAQKLSKEEKYKEAVSEIVSFRKKNQKDDSHLVYLVLGNAYYSMGRKRDSLNTFLKGHRKYPNDENLCKNTALIAYEENNYSLSQELFYKLYNMTKDKRYLFRSAVSLYLKKDMKGADRLLSKLIRNEKNIEWIRLAVAVKVELKRWREAEDVILQYLKNSPEDDRMWRMLAQTYLNMERFRDAAAAMETAFSISKPKKDELKNLAEIYTYAGAALRAAATMAEFSKTEKELIKLAEQYSFAGRPMKSAEIISRLLSEKKSRKLYALRGKYLYNAGKYSRAVMSLVKAGDEDGQSLMMLAMCGWQLNDPAVIRTAYTKASKIKKYSSAALSGLKVLDSLSDD